MIRRRGDFRLIDNKVGGWKFLKVNNLMNFKFLKIGKKEDICFFLRILYSELRMLFYLSNIIFIEKRVWNLSIRFEIFFFLRIMSFKFSWFSIFFFSFIEGLNEEWIVRRDFYWGFLEDF